MAKNYSTYRKFRKGQLCPKCQVSKIEYCQCGCNAHENNNLLCKKCHWCNF